MSGKRAVKAFLVANPKGGSGKSTLATNLAGHLASRGHAVMLGDVDRQRSSRAWLDLRPAWAAPIGTWAIDRDEIARPPTGTTHAVLDTPAGLHGKFLDRVLKLSARHPALRADRRARPQPLRSATRPDRARPGAVAADHRLDRRLMPSRSQGCTVRIRGTSTAEIRR